MLEIKFQITTTVRKICLSPAADRERRRTRGNGVLGRERKREKPAQPEKAACKLLALSSVLLPNEGRNRERLFCLL